MITVLVACVSNKAPSRTRAEDLERRHFTPRPPSERGEPPASRRAQDTRRAADAVTAPAATIEELLAVVQRLERKLDAALKPAPKLLSRRA